MISENPPEFSGRQRIGLGLGLLMLYGVTLLIAAPPMFVVLGSSMLTPLLIWLSITDIEAFVIPDLANIGVAVTGFGFLLWYYPEQLGAHMLGAALAGGLFWAVSAGYRRFRGVDGLGLGDAKFIFGAGLWVGPIGVISVIFMAAVIGVIVTLCVGILRQNRYVGHIPFGPFLAYATFFIWLFGPLL